MRMIWTTQVAFLAAMVVSLFLASGELEATAAAMVVATSIAHVFMLLWVSRDGLLRTAEVFRAYAVHAALFVFIAVIPPLVSQAVVSHSLIATLTVRAAVLIVLALLLWLLRHRIPGLRLGLVRLNVLRSQRLPRHGEPAGQNGRNQNQG
jgi:hypothetical protein